VLLGGQTPPPRKSTVLLGVRAHLWLKFSPPRKYQALDGFKDRTTPVISSGLMIYNKESFIRIPMPHKNLVLWIFPWLRSEN
jgi:hypothetical protein